MSTDFIAVMKDAATLVSDFEGIRNAKDVDRAILVTSQFVKEMSISNFGYKKFYEKRIVICMGALLDALHKYAVAKAEDVLKEKVEAESRCEVVDIDIGNMSKEEEKEVRYAREVCLKAVTVFIENYLHNPDLDSEETEGADFAVIEAARTVFNR